MKGRSSAAVEFLRLWEPQGPWILTAISVDKLSITTRTFRDEDEARGWVDKYCGKRNIYFHVNPASRDLNNKAEKRDISQVRWLHIDIDPRPEKDLHEEQKRALELLQKPPDGIPPPTCTVFSGGGYQGFWKLSEPLEIQGSLERAQRAERYNLQLEVVFDGDHCHNIDRIMRLPGTINIPDDKKRKKGRTEALAELVEWHEDRVYSITEFTPAVPVQSSDTSGLGGEISIEGKIEPVDDIDQLKIPDRIKVIIVQGRHPDEGVKQGDDSRSAWLFDALCGMARSGISPEVMYSVITDKDFGISESVLDKGSRYDVYAKRQIQRAIDYSVEPELLQMNDRHAVIGNIGGRCIVIEEILDRSLGRMRLTRQSFSDIRNRYMNRKVQVGTTKQGRPVYNSLGHWWLEQENRRQYESLVFSPGGDVPGSYNLWKGFNCEALPGTRHHSFIQHVRDNICKGVDEYYQYMMGWMARLVQEPDSTGQVAIVLRGGQGTGKSFFAKTLGSLLGRHYMQVADPKHLVGSFNAHLRDCVLLFGDEAFYAGDKKHESVLKMLITEEMIAIESKGVDAEMSTNFSHVILASNSQWVIPAGADERRFLVLDVGDAHKKDTAYFGAIRKDLDNGGRENLLHHLLTYDLDDFEVRNVPMTEALHEQKILSLDTTEEWWYRKLWSGQIVDGIDWSERVAKRDLVDDYVNYARRFNITKRGSETALGRFLLAMAPGIRDVRAMRDVEVETQSGYVTSARRRVYEYVLPDLETCRQAWEKRFGVQKWPEPGQAGLDLDYAGPDDPPF